MRSLKTQPVTATRQKEMGHSQATPAHSTQQWALMPVVISQRVVTTSTAPLSVSQGSPITMRIGTVKQTKTFITGIRGTATANANAVQVVIDSAGQLGTISSSRRFKDEIKPMDNSSEAILGLKPVTFHYKSDTQNTPQFGLIAEEVAKVNPDLVVRDD